MIGLPKRSIRLGIGGLTVTWAELLGGAFLFFEFVQVGGPPVAALQIGLFGLLTVIYKSAALRALRRNWVFLLLPIWALMSTLWSVAPGETLRYAILLMLTVLAGLVIGETLGPRRFLQILFVAALLFCIVSVASGQKGVSATGPVLIGLTGSKNQMSSAGATLFLLAMVIALDARLKWPLRALALFGVLLGLFIVATTASATGFMVTAGTGIVLLGVIAYRAMGKFYRPILMILAAASAVPLLFLSKYFQNFWGNFQQNILHKDQTLTGRTYLWQVADQLIADRPILGHGYKAIWYSGSASAIGVLHSQNIIDPRGFGFHNDYKEFTTYLGYIGLFLLLVSFSIALSKSLKWALSNPDIISGCMFSTILFMIIRANLEFIINIFLIDTTIFYGCVAAMAVNATSAAKKARRRYRPVPATAL